MYCSWPCCFIVFIVSVTSVVMNRSHMSNELILTHQPCAHVTICDVLIYNRLVFFTTDQRKLPLWTFHSNMNYFCISLPIILQQNLCVLPTTLCYSNSTTWRLCMHDVHSLCDSVFTLICFYLVRMNTSIRVCSVRYKNKKIKRNRANVRKVL